MLFALGPSLRLMYPFRFRDPRTGKWVRARYVAERHVIAERYAEWEITGPAEVHRRGGSWESFNPFRGPATPAAHLPIEEPPEESPPEKPPDGDDDHPIEEPPIEDSSALDELERFLLRVFLRRYVTWCARRRRFAAMEGAAQLHCELRGALRR
jgi:hypothetical protein